MSWRSTRRLPRPRSSASPTPSGVRSDAYLVPAPGGREGELDVDALLGWTRARLAGFKRPREVVLVDELPRTASGKVQKHLLECSRGADAGRRAVSGHRL